MSEWFFQDCIESEQESLLIDAIQADHVGIEDRDCVDRTPLMVALEFRRTSLVRTLLSLGANPNGKSNDGKTCLSHAIDADDAESLDLLLEAGADIEQIGSSFLTPLALAAVRGNVKMIEHLLRRGANIEARGEMEETPLIQACFFGQAEAVASLLRHGANRSAKDSFGNTALVVAHERGGPTVVRVLSAGVRDA